MPIQFKPAIKPTKKQAELYKKWTKYLNDSKLSKDEIRKRAAEYAKQGRKP